MSFTTILIKSLTNTVLGMGTVFLVLIFIAFLISLLPKLTSVIESVGSKNKKTVSSSAREPVSEAPKRLDEKAAKQMEKDLTDDPELIAVITAAIATAEILPTDGFIVRSIRRSAQNQWKKA